MDVKIDKLTQHLVSDKTMSLSKLYLDKLRKMQINLKEFLESIAYMVIQDEYGFAEIRPYSLPAVPYELKEFERLPFEEKQKIKNQIYETERIKTYIAQKREIELKNSSNYKWLCEIRSIIKDKGDPVSLNKIQKKINEFEEKLYE